jgi:hypothetical protein
MTPIKNGAYYQDNQKEFSSQNAYFLFLQKRLPFRKLEDSFLFKFFLQHKK